MTVCAEQLVLEKLDEISKEQSFIRQQGYDNANELRSLREGLLGTVDAGYNNGRVKRLEDGLIEISKRVQTMEDDKFYSAGGVHVIKIGARGAWAIIALAVTGLGSYCQHLWDVYHPGK